MRTVDANTDPGDLPFMLTVEEVAVLLRLGRTKAYELARLYVSSNGAAGIPTVQFGRSLRCPTNMVFEQLIRLAGSESSTISGSAA